MGSCSRKGLRRKNGGKDGGVSLISRDGVAPSQMVALSASVIFLCIPKSRRFLLALAHLGSPGKRAVKLEFFAIMKRTIICFSVLSEIDALKI